MLGAVVAVIVLLIIGASRVRTRRSCWPPPSLCSASAPVCPAGGPHDHPHHPIGIGGCRYDPASPRRARTAGWSGRRVLAVLVIASRLDRDSSGVVKPCLMSQV